MYIEPEVILDIFLDALKDSALAFAVIFVFEVILSFVKIKMKDILEKHPKLAPLFGSLFGLIPQCGTSVLSADLYLGHHIGVGTLIAIFLATSDEAIPLMITSGNEKALMLLPLIALKVLIGFVFGFLIDLVLSKKEKISLDENVELEECHHDDHHNHKHDDKFHEHIIHPLHHSLELFVYVLLINILFGYSIALIGESNFAAFIESNKYLTPLYASIIGLIPNCASSVLITEMFLSNSIPFGALLSGLLVNAGLGFVVLFKSKKDIKNTLLIILTCFVISVLSGYIACLISGF